MALLERQSAAEQERREPTLGDDAIERIHGDVSAVQGWRA